MRLSQILLLGLAGGLGTLSRFGLGGLVTRALAHPEPWGTTAINILGCFCFGLIAEMFRIHEGWSLQTRTIILTGFFGAFTTFSTYMFELHSLMVGGSIMRACAGFLLQNLLGFMAVAFGIFLIRHILTF